MSAQSKTANKSDIDLHITTNGNNEITGAELNGILDNLVDSYEDFVGSYTTAQIAALVGMTERQRVYNTDDNDYEYYDGTRWVKEAHPKCKVYIATLTQSGTNAPVATVGENTLGGTLVWTRNGVGDYTGTLAGAFPAKVFLFCQNIVTSSPFTYIQLYEGTVDTVKISTLDASSTQADGILITETAIRIEVYY